MSAPAKTVPANPAEAPAGRKSGMLMIVGIVGAVGLIQAVMTVFLVMHLSAEPQLVPDPIAEPAEVVDQGHGEADHGHGGEHGQEAAHGADSHGGGHGAHGGEHGKSAHGHSASEAEVDLGQYAATIWQPERQTSLLISFQLYGTVKSAQAGEFESRYEEKKHRIRERLLVAARQLSLNDVTDPSLANLRSIAVKIVNEQLGKRMVDSIVVSEFVHAEK